MRWTTMTLRNAPPLGLPAIAAIAAMWLAAIAACPIGYGAETGADGLGYVDTPRLPNSPWRVHDRARPQAPKVTPGTAGLSSEAATPPSDAVVLFDGKDLSNWMDVKGQPSKWVVRDGYMESVKGAGYVRTRQEFGSVQLHVEFATPSVVTGAGQGRGNSGVFLQGKYEVQVLDSYDNKTYPDGQCGALYGRAVPLVNASCQRRRTSLCSPGTSIASSFSGSGTPFGQGSTSITW